ncbi:MAG: uL15 family ribosomal protein [Candidatus Paceibacterota bacterium]|jgi:large subunit ribosomal protein L15
MQLHELQPKNSFKKKKRVGRGGKKGTYSGVGGKGQKGRAGSRFKPLIREWLKKYPKLKGYNFNIIAEPSAPVDLSNLEKNFENKEIVSPKTLALKKIISSKNGKLPLVKITGLGDLTKAIIINGCAVSKKAKEKIEKAGGEIKTKPKIKKSESKKPVSKKIKKSAK